MVVTLIIKPRLAFFTALIVIFIWLGANGVLRPLFGSLSTVQKNENSAFLPQIAESTSHDIGSKISWPAKLANK